MVRRISFALSFAILAIAGCANNNIIDVKQTNDRHLEVNISRFVERFGCPTAIRIVSVDHEYRKDAFSFDARPRWDNCPKHLLFPKDFEKFTEKQSVANMDKHFSVGKYSINLEFNRVVYQRDFIIK